MKDKVVLGVLTLIEKLPTVKVSTPSCKRKYQYRFMGKYKCFCGSVFIAQINKVKTGSTKSCGCYRAAKLSNIAYKDGRCNKHARLLAIWRGLHNRCYRNLKNTKIYYKEKGIIVCNEWKTFEPFRDWALNNGYKKHLTIDRKDSNGNYSPDNCRWVTSEVQNVNKSIMKTNTSGYTGVSKSGNKWIASITFNDKTKYLGRFDDIIEASNVYQAAKKKRDNQYLKQINLKRKTHAKHERSRR